MIRIPFLLLITLMAFTTPNAAIAIEIPSADIEFLGTPYADDYHHTEEAYARNVWDLQFYQGLLFIGAGNSSNIGPATNAGPVRIRYFDPAGEQFVNEGIAREEQIDRFRILNDSLYIPGHDPLANWSLGNFYSRLPEGQWVMYRNIPGAIHNYDMAVYKGRMYAALGISGGAAVAVSNDNGGSWSNFSVGRSRSYTFLQSRGKLYATKKITDDNYQVSNGFSSIWELEGDGEFVPRPDLFDRILFPDTDFDETGSMKIVRSVAVRWKNVYIGGYIHNDHQARPFGLYIAHTLERGVVHITAVRAPTGMVPMDLLLRDDYIYALYVKPAYNGNYRVFVRRASVRKLWQWLPYLSFTAAALPRSFEESSGDFYFGLGTEVAEPTNWTLSELNSNAGGILRIKAEAITKNE
jgi:hypothetical protein